MKTPRATIAYADWRIPSRGFLRGSLAAISAVVLLSMTVASIADDKKETPKAADSETVLCLELPHPDRLLDRLTDPRMQDYLKLSQQYQKLAGGKQLAELRSVAGVVAGQLNTTWEEGLRDLTGGGISAQVEITPGQAPRFNVLITARKPELLQKTSDVVLKLARQDAQQKGKPDPAKTLTHRGAAIVSLGGEGGTIAYCIADGKLLASNSVQNVQQLIDRGIALAAKAGKPAPEGKADGALTALGDAPRWKAIRDRQGPDTLAWSFVDLERLRQIDPKRFGYADQPNTGITLFFGSWYEALRKAPSATASISWSDTELAANIDLPQPKEGRAATLKGYVPTAGKGAAPLIEPPGTIGSLSLWRDWASIWEAKADLFSPESVQGFAQLDTLAGQFFGVREFGPDVLGAFEPHWRLVVAAQDFGSIKPVPDVKLPGFALVTELNAPDSDFAQRLKVAFQTFVGLSNVDAVQKKGPPFELVSEQVDGVTLSSARYMVPSTTTPAATSPDQRYNFSPSAAQVGKYFFLSSSAGLARALIKELKKTEAARTAASASDETAVLEADGAQLARLLELNRGRLAMQLMLNRGETKEKAESQVDLGLALVRYLGHGRLAIRDSAGATSLQLKLKLSK